MITDSIGNTLDIGNYICYPTQVGHSVSMNIGKVIGFNYTDDAQLKSIRVQGVVIWYNEKPAKFRKASLTKFQNIVKLDEACIPGIFIRAING